MKRRNDPPHTDDLYGPRYGKRRYDRRALLLLAVSLAILAMVLIGIAIGR